MNVIIFDTVQDKYQLIENNRYNTAKMSNLIFG